MSVLNVAVMPDEILLLSDTLVYGRDGKPLGLCERKAAISRAGRFITSVRGNLFFSGLAQSINDDLISLDEALSFWRAHLENMDSAGHQPSGCMLVMCGWSDDLGRMAAVRFVTTIADGRLAVEETALPLGIELNPEFTGRVASMLPKTADERIMVRLALAQHKVFYGKHGMDLCIGGVMRMFSVTKDGAREWIAGLYPDYGQLTYRFTDPNADEIAALNLLARGAA